MRPRSAGARAGGCGWHQSRRRGALPPSPRFSAYNRHVVSGRDRLGVFFKVFIAVYIAALASLPFAHHDLACHLKSSNHCGVCHVGTSSDDGSQRPSLPHKDLSDVGRAGHAPVSFAVGCVPRSSSGRSPPPDALFSL